MFKYRLTFATDERRIVSGKVFHNYGVLWKPICVSFVATDQWASPNTLWKAFPDTILRSSGRKNQAKFENDCISRGGHRFKITLPKLVILV